MRKVALLILLAVALAGCRERTAQEPPSPDKASDPAPPVGTRFPQRGTSVQFPFVDATAESGVDFVHENGAAGRRHFPETMGPGVALFDADGDGDLDLYAVNGAPWSGPDPGVVNRLFANRGDGTFEDATDLSGLGDPGYGMGAAVGDYDGDGDGDLYVLNYGPNVLYRNLGEGRFEAVEAGVGDPSWSIAGAFLDYDGDGDLDLYVVNYLDYDVTRVEPCKAGTLTIYCSPENFPPASDRLFRNEGGRFTDVTREAGITPDGRGMGLGVSDLDGDGDPDLVVANDRSQNQLYRNTGAGFEEVGAELGVGYGETGQFEGGMGVVVGDLTGTGAPAIFHTNFQKEPNRFFIGDGSGFFDDRSLESGLGFPSYERVSWGIGLLDVEGDGDLDLAVANGHVYDNAAEFIAGSAYGMRDQLFTADGRGRFETSEFPGPARPSRGVASGDLDGDGDPDLVITTCAGPLRVWRNEAGRPERWLVVELAGRPPNTGALGGRVTAWVGERRLYREVAGGGSYASESDRRVYLGLGSAASADRIEVRWPGGGVEEALEVEGGRSVVWREGEGIVSSRELTPRSRP